MSGSSVLVGSGWCIYSSLHYLGSVVVVEKVSMGQRSSRRKYLADRDVVSLSSEVVVTENSRRRSLFTRSWRRRRGRKRELGTRDSRKLFTQSLDGIGRNGSSE